MVKNKNSNSVLKYFTTAIPLFMAFLSSAQEDTVRSVMISYAPAGLVNKVRIKAEFPVKEKVSAGTFINVHYFTFRGLQAEPFVRFYLSDEYPVGYYLQLKVSGGYFSSKMDFIHTVNDTSKYTITQTHSFPGVGAGIAFGYQYITRKQKYFDFFLGYKYMPYLGPDHIYEQGKVYRTEADFEWYSIGPGSYFNGHFGIGFTF